jgi:hypothetical protein
MLPHKNLHKTEEDETEEDEELLNIDEEEVEE